MSVIGLVRVEPRAAPFEWKVAGLPLLLRAVLVLKQAGLAPVRVLCAQTARESVRSLLETRGLDDVEIVDQLPADGPSVVLPHDVVCAPAVIRALAEAPGTAVAVKRGEIVGPERLDGADREPLSLEVGAALVERVDGPTGEARAIRGLFEACRKPVDGIISRHLNRHLSIFVSKRIVDTSITPNATTVATFLVGLLAAAAVSRGGYTYTLLGAALLQCNSVLDGVDGELARVRHEHSHLGQWLDTVSDDLVNVAFWAALGVGAAGLPHGQLLRQAGFVAAVAQLVLAATYWTELVSLGSGDAYDIDWWFRRAPPTGLRGRVLSALLLIPKKDFFIFFCLVCAVFGALSYVLPLVALAAVGAAAAGLARGIGRLVPKPEIDGLASRRSER